MQNGQKQIKTGNHYFLVFAFPLSFKIADTQSLVIQSAFNYSLLLFHFTASGGIPDYVYVLISIIVLLAVLLVAAVIYMVYQRRQLKALSNA